MAWCGAVQDACLQLSDDSDSLLCAQSLPRLYLSAVVTLRPVGSISTLWILLVVCVVGRHLAACV